jgi:polysaccharide biosynthesis/export protein
LRARVHRINLGAALQGGDTSQDVYLRSNDIVYVPKSAIANVNTWIDQYIRKNIPIPLGVSVGRTF